MSEKATRVRELLLAGTKYPEISRQTGAASSTIAYHAEKLGLRKQSYIKPKYDWNEIQAYYDNGYCISEVIEKFRMTWGSLMAARQRGVVTMNIRNRPRKIKNAKKYTDEFIFSDESIISFGVVKKRFKELYRYACVGEDCVLGGIEKPTWANKPIVLHLDHINGKRTDNTVTNLRWLCPNCHSQTITYCGRNKGK